MSDTITIDGVGPLPVVRPATVAELATSSAAAPTRRQAVYPVGGRTMLDFGLPPARPGIAVDLTVASTRSSTTRPAT